MNQKKREAMLHPVTRHETVPLEPCTCQPLASFPAESFTYRAGEEQEGAITPASSALHTRLSARIEALLPDIQSVSILLLHISQLEHIHISPQTAVLHKRQRYHAPAEVLEQVLVNARRAIRQSDEVITDPAIGAAFLLPEVDQQGAEIVLERVYHNINLLQPETLIPPLTRETDILLGVGTYPQPGSSLEKLLTAASTTARRITLRPAITTQLWDIKVPEEEVPVTAQIPPAPLPGKQNRAVPFMQLPQRVPPRLRQLVPYQTACTLRCAPVGRDHHNLTMAMADPTDREAIAHLQEITGMTIFPVFCDCSALDTLLQEKW